VLLAGDLNVRASDPVFDTLRAGRADAAAIAADHVVTGTGEGIAHSRREIAPAHAIDHVAVPAGSVVMRFEHGAPTYDGRRPSDHPVIVADVVLPRGRPRAAE
jgi:endonuclease/exonuclease/phosphatase family metal-dependent hydrolase